MKRVELEEKIRELTKVLGGSLKNLGLYPENHPQVKRSNRQAFDLISAIIRVRRELALTLLDETIVFEGTPIFHSTSALELFTQSLIDCGIEGLVFKEGVSEEEIAGFNAILHSHIGRKLTSSEIEELFNQRKITHIQVVTPDEEDEDEDLAEAKEIYDSALSAVASIMKEIRFGQIPSGGESRKVVQDMSHMLKKNQDAILALTMIKNYDEYTYTHSVNVAVISLALAESLSLSESEKIDIGIAGLLHDVGKTQLALEVIRKPSSLTLEEFEDVKKHPEEGFKILSEMEFINPISAKIVREHHMGYDLSGYPNAEEGYKLEPLSHIISTSDCYDALTTLRTYQKPRIPKEALVLMTKMAGKSLDPAMVKVLIKTLGIYPIGTMVRLDTDEVAVVSAQSPEDNTRPKVIILADNKGKQLDFPVHFDLMEKDPETGKYKKTIVTTVNPVLENSDPSRSVA